MLEKTPDDARSRSKDDPFQLPTEAASEFLAFEYSDEQWTEIEKSLRHLNPNQADLEKARRRLVSAARRYRAVMVNAPLAKARERWLARNWARVLKLSDELMSLLDRVGKGEAPRPPKPNGGPPADPLRAHKEALMKLNVVARGRMAAPRLDDGLPTAGPRAWFHLYVLETWTYLGGKLEYSRNRRNKIAGPLARYFAAATQPVHGGSPESLPDIVERHKAMLPALNRWRVSNLAVSVRDYLCLNEPLLVSELAQDVRDLLEFCESTADALAGEIDPDSVAEAVSEDMDKFGGAPDWIKQEDVQALVKEGLEGSPFGVMGRRAAFGGRGFPMSWGTIARRFFSGPHFDSRPERVHMWRIATSHGSTACRSRPTRWPRTWGPQPLSRFVSPDPYCAASRTGVGACRASRLVQSPAGS